MSNITRSASMHHLYPEYVATNVKKVFQEWNKCLPYVRPLYSVSPASSSDLVSVLRDRHIQMVCHTPREVKLVNHSGLVLVDGERIGSHECIVRNIEALRPRVNILPASLSSVPLLVHTKISNEGLDHSRKMFDYIWANKYILNGIVFDIDNFTNPTQSIPPSMYSYKVAMDYVFRNIVYPFQKEYGIVIPSIIIDGRNHITRIQHLYELHEQGLRDCKFLWEKHSTSKNQPKIRLIVGTLFDTCHE